MSPSLQQLNACPKLLESQIIYLYSLLECRLEVYCLTSVDTLIFQRIELAHNRLLALNIRMTPVLFKKPAAYTTSLVSEYTTHLSSFTTHHAVMHIRLML